MNGFKWVYLALSLAAAICLGITFFIETKVLNQLTFLIQSVGFAFVSGLFFGSK